VVYASGSRIRSVTAEHPLAAVGGRRDHEPPLLKRYVSRITRIVIEMRLRGPKMVKGRYRPPTMTLANFEKDLAIIAAFARKVGARTPLFSAAAPIYAAATRKNPSLDTAAVCAVLEKMARPSKPMG
jgi:hypothetical protein